MWGRTAALGKKGKGCSPLLSCILSEGLRITSAAKILERMSESLYPAWTNNLVSRYFARTANVFVLHGNVRDWVRYSDATGEACYVPLPSFLRTELFAPRSIVMHYDRAAGLCMWPASARARFEQRLSATSTTTVLGPWTPPTGAVSEPMGELASGRLRYPLSVTDLIAQLSGFFEEAIQRGARLALTMDYADAIIPALQGAYESAEERAIRVHFLKWASEPQYLATDFSVCLITDELARIDPQLAQHARVATIALPLPTSEERLAYLSWLAASGSVDGAPRGDRAAQASMANPSLAEHTAGMSLVQIQAMLAEAQQSLGALAPPDEPPVLHPSTVADYKKRAIEQEARDLLSFIPPRGNLDDVAGHQVAVAKLRRMARLIREGRSRESLPMGYLISGPVGTGKTHLVSKLAGEMGIPMVTLKNFRSQWQGGTEANLEKIFALLAALQPVAVVIDEADAALGTRHAKGDAGVSGRVFSALASFMSRPQHRGKIMFFLLTSRPDLLPVDLKRQGRAEEHVSLFYPEDPIEHEAVVRWFLARSGMDLSYDALPEAIRNPVRPLSGAEIESLLARTRLEAAADNVPVTPDLLQYVWDTFLPPDYAEDVAYQTLVAALECTDRSLLPPSLRDLDRAALAARVRREAR